MKKILLLLVVLSTSLLVANAQNRYYNQSVISVFGSFGNYGMGGGIALEKYLGRTTGAIRGALIYTNGEYELDNFNIPIIRTRLEVSYLYSLENNMSTNFFISLGAGFHIGGEKLNKKDIESNIYYNTDMKLSSGLVLYPQANIKLSDSVNLLIEPQLIYNYATSFDEFLYGGRLGVKIYL